MSRKQPLDEAVRKAREEMDNYKETVHALWALVSVATWNPQSRMVDRDARFAVGRRMTLEGARESGEQEEITPDLVAQISQEYGLVAEAKRSLPREDSHWDSALQQLEKYGKPLRGWWTPDEKVSAHDAAALVHISLGPRFASYVEEAVRAGRFDSSASPAVVEFARIQQVSERIHLCLRKGSLRHAAIDGRLRDGVPVPMDEVIATYGQRDFYDAEPPVEYLLRMIWQEIVAPRKAGQPRDERRRCWPIVVSCRDITTELQKAHGQRAETPREAEYPKISWVANALDTLTPLGLARRLDTDRYEVLYREIRVDLVERFAGRRLIVGRGRRPKRRTAARDKSTLDLPFDSPRA